MPPVKPIEIVVFVVACLVLAVIGFFLGSVYRRKSAEKTIGSAEEEAKRILGDAMKTAETKKKETLLEAKEEIHQLRQDTERDLRERRSEVQRQEHRIQQKEESLDKKMDNIEAKEEKLAQRAKEIDAKLEECEQLKRGQLEMLAAKHQKINVACRGRFVAGIRAENIDLADMVFFRERLHNALNVGEG